jgi:hypothetical protein
MKLFSKGSLTGLDTPVVSWLPGRPSRMTRRRLPALLSHPKFGLFTHGDTERLLKDMGLTPDRDYAIIEPGIDLELIDATPKERRLVRGKLNVLSLRGLPSSGISRAPPLLSTKQVACLHCFIACVLFTCPKT